MEQAVVKQLSPAGLPGHRSWAAVVEGPEYLVDSGLALATAAVVVLSAEVAEVALAGVVEDSISLGLQTVPDWQVSGRGPAVGEERGEEEA